MSSKEKKEKKSKKGDKEGKEGKEGKDGKSKEGKEKKSSSEVAEAPASIIPNSADTNTQQQAAEEMFSRGGLGLGPGGVPMELISNRVLTHFDETAGVAIGRHEVDQHIAMGNVVKALTDSYRTRYERLRALLTTRLFPKREHLLSLRRQLAHLSADLEAKRRSIEKETLSDAEQILERLRTVESMRQSALKNEILNIEASLHDIERLVRRVERANIESGFSTSVTPGSGGGIGASLANVLLTSANPGSAVLEGVKGPKAVEMVELIHEFGDLSISIEQSATAPVHVQLDFPKDDFPREVKDRLEVITKCDKFIHALHIKDQMLYTVLQENEQLKMLLHEEKALTADYANEMSEWAEVTQHMKQELLSSKERERKQQNKIFAMLRVMKEHGIYFDNSDP